MKNIHRIFSILMLLGAILLSSTSFAATDPPDPPGEHGQQGDQAGGGAPLGGGLFILLGLGAAYGTKKLYDSRKEPLEE